MKIKSSLPAMLVLLVVCLAWWRWGNVSTNETGKPDERKTIWSGKNASVEANKRIEQAKNDPRLQPFINGEWLYDGLPQRPPLSVLKNLKESDEAILLIAYKHTTNLLERSSLTWALGYIGGDASFAALKHTLTDEFRGRLITSRRPSETNGESETMFKTVEALGLMAARNDAAFAFLQQGSDPWFWQRSVGWKSKNGPDDYGILAAHSITGIAMSGRKEVPEILEALSKQPLENSPDPHNWKRTFYLEVVRAAFQHAFIRDRGRDAFFEWYFSPPDDTLRKDGGRRIWMTTPEGRKWAEWGEKFEKEKLAQRKAANRWP